MARRRRRRAPRWATVTIVGGLIGVAVLVSLALTRATPGASSDLHATGSAGATSDETGPAGGLALPAAGAAILVVGDSYSLGYAAEPLDSGYPNRLAEAFGWRLTVSAGSGSGYLTAGTDGETYLERIAHLPRSDPQLILVQGGLNDAPQRATVAQLSAAGAAVLQALHDKFPAAALVVLGPIKGPSVPEAGLESVDKGLAAAAAASGAHYISPLQEGWNLSPYLIADAIHPDTEGHRYIADRLIADLTAASAGPSDAPTTVPSG